MAKNLTVIKNLNIVICNDCPYCNEYVDTSVCYDSFDEPNYEFYCKHKDVDNSKFATSKLNCLHGKFISLSYSRFDKNCRIPNWCPLEDC